MGTQEVSARLDSEQRQAFTRAVLRDARCLEKMLAEGRFETGVRRIGAEQELVLVDPRWQPAPIAEDVLGGITDPRVTTEIARFNVEFNLDPLVFSGDCLTRLERGLGEGLDLVRDAARELGANAMLAGILPTLSMRHLGLDNIVDRPRYHALNDAIMSARGAGCELRIKGADELVVQHDNIMLEALNTSFQLHFQVDPERFGPTYNIAQLVAAPVLAIAANSPILFGKRLWHETRIAIFQQAIDTRRDAPAGRDQTARVRFGESWIDDSVIEIFRHDITRFRAMIGREGVGDPECELSEGRAPKLEALQLHNSTIYRWNRACYGVTDGRPHLRIENRVLPAGPSLVDQTANAALWLGLMAAGQDAFGDVRERMDFEDASGNFTAAARQGVNAEFAWLDGRTAGVPELLTAELIPVAQEGLRREGVDQGDIDKYLGVIRERAESRKTGATWLLKSVSRLKGSGTRAERLTALAAGIGARQATNQPVHTWELVELAEAGGWRTCYAVVEQFMRTDPLTVQEDEVIDLVAALMDWEKVRHVPVEDADHRLVGLVSYRSLLRVGANEAMRQGGIAVRDVMLRDPVTIGPQTSTLDAAKLMREKGVSCLPVIEEGKLVGIVNDHDMTDLAMRVLVDALEGEQQ